MSEIFHQEGLLKKIRDTGVTYDKELGTCTGRVLNGSMLGATTIIEKSKLVVLESDLIESKVMSDLMIDFPPISREDPPEVLAQYVAQYLKDTRKAIAWSQIPLKVDASLKLISRKRKQAESEDEKEEEPKKKVKNAKASKHAASGIHKEVAELEPSQVLTKRTRGRGSDAASQAHKVVRKTLQKPKKVTRKLKLSAKTSKDLTGEERTIMAQVVVKKHVEAAKKVLEMSKELEQSAMGQASEILKTKMQIKQEQGISEFVGLDVEATRNIASSTLSEPIDLDSPSHNSPHINDQPLSSVYSNL